VNDDNACPALKDYNYGGGRLFVRLGGVKVSRYLTKPSTTSETTSELHLLANAGGLREEIVAVGHLRPDSLIVLGRKGPPVESLLVVLVPFQAAQCASAWESARHALQYGIQYADKASEPLGPVLDSFVSFVERAIPDLDASTPTAELLCTASTQSRAQEKEWILTLRVAPVALEQFTRDYLAGYRPSLSVGVSLRTVLNTCHESWRRDDEPKVYGVLDLPMAGAAAYGWLTDFRYTLRPLGNRHDKHSADAPLG